MSKEPITVESPSEAEPPTIPTTANVPNDPPNGFVPGHGEAVSGGEKKARTKKVKTEFDILCDIQSSFESLPSDHARRRVWDYLRSWLTENYGYDTPHPGSLTSELAESLYGIR